MTFHYQIALYIFHISNKILLGGGERKGKKQNAQETQPHTCFLNRKWRFLLLICFLKEAMFSTEKQFRWTLSLAVLLQS